MIINIVKKLFEVSQSFTHIFRYYKSNLLDLLLVVRTMIVYEINVKKFYYLVFISYHKKKSRYPIGIVYAKLFEGTLENGQRY